MIRVRSLRSLPLTAWCSVLLLAAAACNGGVQPVPGQGDAGGNDAGDNDTNPATSSCAACVSSNDCSGSESCVLLEDDSVCLAPCMATDDCAAGQVCAALRTAEGHAITACIASDNSCGTLPVLTQDGGTVPIVGGQDAGSRPGEDAGSSMPPDGWCGPLAGPSVSGTMCYCGKPGQCAANNCYGGWYCDTTTNKCVSPPSNCSTPDAGPGPGPVDAGTPPGPTGPIDAHNGGTTDNLIFAVVGDTRPGGINGTSNYPKAIIDGIYAAISRLNPEPDFVVTTGDYMFASTTGGQASPQMAMYMQAVHQVSIPLWPAMGNHECTGATNSNCGPENGNITDNYNVFMQNMMKPIGESLPYFMRRVDATDGSWTAKFIWVAPNAWGPIEASWLQQQLAQQTTYTFVIHHESSSVTQAPGISQINSIVRQHPVTISIVGHTHTWEWKTNEVVIGNGGAPLTSTVPYGYTIFQRRPSDGAIQITAYDYTNGQSFQQHNITATGGAAP